MSAGSTGRVLAVLAAVACFGAAVAVAYALSSTAWGDGVERSVADAVSGWRDGVWRLLRGGFGRIVPPFMVVLIVVLTVVAYRRSPRLALFAGLVAAGSNVTVQAVKAGWLPFPGARPSGDVLLSGHVPLVLSGALLAVVVAPAAARRWVTVVAVLAVAATFAEVVISGWHTVGETLAPALIVLAWVLLAVAVTGGTRAPSALPVERRRA
ncbi:hypothetical protein E1212_06855 [Jiangella ureilytica]|uniref:Phosphatase PAP2 family protein n=1 Tax=Jiangella ureilytica TaxID=2530374 RepID=A0A4R4RSV9_9ACTN|nr:hypothetical protein [Jiangella ureilytica]TDC53131.1 hypothetical protein E1212_06855 [Jiangella ureilytica]